MAVIVRIAIKSIERIAIASIGVRVRMAIAMDVYL